MPESAPPRARVLPITALDGFILLALLCGMYYGIGSYGLYEPHEGHFAGVGREMFLSGDWITPHLNGAPYLNKPPIFYWLIATSFSLFGIGDGAARLPQVLIAWAGVVLAWKWARELFGARAGQAAAIILGVSAGWYLFAHQLIIDELLCVLHLFSLYTLWKCVCDPGSSRAWLNFFIVLGVSIMAKGPIGPLLILLVWLVFAAMRGDWSSFKRCRLFPGFLVMLLIIAPWLIMIEVRNPGFLRYQIVNELINRALDKRWPPDYQVSKTSAVMFVLIALIWMAPWSLLLPQISGFTYRVSRRPVTSKISARADAVLLLALGALLPTVSFLPIPSRLIYYCLPTLPPFAILAAGWWSSLEEPREGQNARLPHWISNRVPPGVVFTLIGIAVIVVGFYIGPLLKSKPEIMAAPEILNFMPGFAALIGSALTLGGILMLAGRPFTGMLALGLLLLIGEAANTAGFAAFDQVRSSKRMITELLPKTKSDWIWIYEGSLELGAAGGMAFYLGTDDQGHARTLRVMKEQIEPDEKGEIHVSARRTPPSFPGPEPAYLLSGTELRTIWSGPKPALFITDFLRDDPNIDPPNLPPEPRHPIPVSAAGQRKVYANEAAWRLMKK